jgi:hypothetical protein
LATSCLSPAKRPIENRKGPLIAILQKIEGFYENKMRNINDENENLKEIILSFKNILLGKD